MSAPKFGVRFRGGFGEGLRGGFRAGFGSRTRQAGIALAMLTGVVMAMVAVPGAAQEIKGDAAAGARKNAMCIGCHSISGYRTAYPTVYSVPKIHGQTSRYIELALSAYRSGDRDHPSMRAIAGSLTDQDIADLAAYYGKSLETK